MAKKARFGDWTQGEVKETTPYHVSYRVVGPSGQRYQGTIGVVVRGPKEAAGKKVHDRLRKRWPERGFTIEIRSIWKPGETPSGLALPPGTVWVDDEVGGKKQNP
jgi:hypothetical protein